MPELTKQAALDEQGAAFVQINCPVHGDVTLNCYEFTTNVPAHGRRVTAFCMMCLVDSLKELGIPFHEEVKLPCQPVDTSPSPPSA